MSEEKYRPVKGDRVRVVLEGEVTQVDSLGVMLKNKFGSSYASEPTTVSVEKLEPPVEVFGPGDTVRSRHHPHLIYSIGDGGNYAHHAREWRPAGEDDSYFTSASHERVDL